MLMTSSCRSYRPGKGNPKTHSLERVFYFYGNADNKHSEVCPKNAVSFVFFFYHADVRHVFLNNKGVRLTVLTSKRQRTRLLTLTRKET